MEYDINKIRSLCDRYFDGESTAAEELMLRDYFTRVQEVPEDLKAVKVMMGGFSQAAAMTYRPSGAEKKGVVRRIIWGTVAAVASVALCVGLMNRETYGYDIDGRAITDPVAALEGVSYLTHLEKLETTIDIAEMLTGKIENNDLTNRP